MKKNPFLIGYLAVTAVGAAALGYLVYSGYNHYTEVTENYDTQVQKLLSLKNRTPFPSEENNAAYKKLTAEYKSEYEKLVGEIRGMQQPVESITPQAFQDRLKAMVSEVEAAASKNNVVLTPGFYLGFDKYQSTLPSNEAAGPLARELAAIRLVVDLLIENKVRTITSIRRDALPEEGGSTPEATPSRRSSGPGSQQQATPGGRSPSAAPASNIIQRATFDVVFESDQSRFRQAVNSITRAPQFLVIRSLNVRNSATEGPTRAASPDAGNPAPAAPPAAPAGAPAPDLNAILGGNANGTPAEGGPAQPATNTVRVLVGQETLTTALRIELLTFNLGNSKE